MPSSTSSLTDGEEPNRSDLAMVEHALLHNWDIPADVFRDLPRQIVERLGRLHKKSGKPKKSTAREFNRLARLLVLMHGQNRDAPGSAGPESNVGGIVVGDQITNLLLADQELTDAIRAQLGGGDGGQTLPGLLGGNGQSVAPGANGNGARRRPRSSNGDGLDDEPAPQSD